MAIELLGAKILAIYYGNSLYVWTSVLGITLAGLAAGYFAGGFVSGKFPKIHTLFYVFLIIAKPKFKIPDNTKSAGLGGTLSGLIAGTFGIGGPVRSMFLSAFNLPKGTYLFTSGAIALFIDPARLATYILGGTKLPENLFWGLFIFIPITFIGSKIAKKFVDRIPQKKFRNVIAIFLFLAGAKLLIFP